jgi:N-acetylneuraminic acid mutarotase
MLNQVASRVVIATLAISASLGSINIANGHFVWLAVTGQDKASGQQSGEINTNGGSLEVYFGESAAPDNPKLLDMLSKLQLWQISGDADPQAIQATRQGDSLNAKVSDSSKAGGKNAIYVASQDFGVRDKGGEKFRLMYYAKTGPTVDSPAWQKVNVAEAIAFDIVPKISGGKVELKLQFKGSPAADCEMVILGPDDSDGEDFEGKSDADGKYVFGTTMPGRYSIRAKHVENTPGKVGDEVYDVVRHYVTLTLDVPASSVPFEVKNLGELPTTLTSFGGAVLGDYVYIYGGTKGSSHDYSSEMQNDSLMRMPIAGGEWEAIAKGPHLQGLALVAHGEKLYRIGGFEARNKKGDEHDLWSVASVSSFDPKTNQWSDMPALPEPRSSFDAVVMDDHIYVVGGWGMAGGGRSTWHETAWKMDLTQEEPQWAAIAKTPFERRALALAAHDGKLFAIGGITSGGETSLETDVYDPKTDSWTTGPELVGEDGMTGFGASAFATGGNLYISTVDGSFQQLSSDGSKWTVVGQTPTARFFHRMLPVSDNAFVVVGGSNMRGRIKIVERFEVPSLAKKD